MIHKVIVQLVGLSPTLSWKKKLYTISSYRHYRRRQSSRFLNSSRLKAVHGVPLLLYLPRIFLVFVGKVLLDVSLNSKVNYYASWLFRTIGGGWASTGYFMDPTTGIAAVFGVQIVPNDTEATKMNLKLERTLYKGLSLESDKVWNMEVIYL